MKNLFVFSLVLMSVHLCFASSTSFITVAKDGSGEFTTIQAAINSIPANNASNVTIYVKNGVYNEHILIDKSFISLIGESRDGTRIEYSIDRDAWKKARGKSDNNGSGVIDIGISVVDTFQVIAVSNIIIGNMTIVNTIATTEVYTHTIRGEGSSTKIWVVHCNVWAKGKDTIGLWNKTTGMYYHTDCNFKGGIDAVCPRGWCYAVSCEFYQTASSAPIWHEGLEGSSQKFVIRKPFIDHDSTRTFKLTNGQKEYEIFIMDGTFSEKVSGSGLVTSVYYFNCKGGLKDTNFYKNNLTSAPGSPKQNEITAKWTFKDAAESWDPENEMPSVLQFSSLPQPWKGAYEIPSSVQLRWVKARDAEQNAVYLGTDSNALPLVKTQAENSYQCSGLKSGTYYWRVDAIKGSATVTGAVWSFTVDQRVPVVNESHPAENNNRFNAVMKNGSLLCEYRLNNNGTVAIALLNIQGKTLWISPLSHKSAGLHSDNINVNRTTFPAGKYVVRLKIGNVVQTADVIIR